MNLSHELRTLIVWAHLKVWWNQCISTRWKQWTLPKRHSLCLSAKVAQVHARWLALVMVWNCRMWCICSVYRFLTDLLNQNGPILFIWLFLLACQHPSGCFGYESSHQLVTPSDPTLSGGFFLCIKVLPFTVRDYTGSIVLSTDTNAYLAVSFICNSAWVMTMKSYDGWQSFEPVVQNPQKANNIVIKRAFQKKCCIVLFIFRFCRWLTSSFHPFISSIQTGCVISVISLIYVPRVQVC